MTLDGLYTIYIYLSRTVTVWTSLVHIQSDGEYSNTEYMKSSDVSWTLHICIVFLIHIFGLNDPYIPTEWTELYFYSSQSKVATVFNWTLMKKRLRSMIRHCTGQTWTSIPCICTNVSRRCASDIILFIPCFLRWELTSILHANVILATTCTLTQYNANTVSQQTTQSLHKHACSSPSVGTR